MQAEIETLLIVQDRDQKISGCSKQLAHIPDDEADAKRRLQGDEKALVECKAEIQANEIEMKNLELDIDTRKESVARLKVQQFETKKNEEFRAMGVEIERYGDEVAALEDRELEFMEIGEQLKKKLAGATAALAATQVLVDEELADLESRTENLNKELADLEKERSEIATGLDEDIVEVFDRLMKNKNGVAVVALKEGQCSGCHVRVISATVVEAKAEKGLTHCENCGRIVYFAN
ncbi:MAG: C4-type zinc ribbon domain-containing protein [Verrucomicrobiota bacterium]